MPVHHSRRKIRRMPTFRLCPLALGLITFCPTWAFADGYYTVTGAVVTAQGITVPGASVVAWPVIEGGSAASLHWVPADDAGIFKLKLPRGSYQIRAKDERHGYPDPNLLLSADASAHFPTVKVDDASVDGVRVILGEQGGILRILVRDRGTLHPIAGAMAIVRDARDATAFVKLGADDHGNIQFAVPHKALAIVAEAPGYFRESFHNGEEVELSNGDQKEITFDLRRE